MELIRLTGTEDKRYERAMRLYRASFPPHEQRSAAAQAMALRDEDYHFGLVYDGGAFAGLLLYWEAPAQKGGPACTAEQGFVYVEHFCILPELRGSAPVQRSILNHCDEAGVTAMYLSAGMDEGDIIEIRKTVIQPLETSEELMARLAAIAAPLCADTVRAIENGTAKRIPQDPSRATYAPMLRKDESPIDWDQPARYIIDQVRGLVPWPVATATLGGTEFKIYRVEYTDQKTEKAPGALVALTKKGLLVACRGGDVVLVRELQAQGGKRMPASDYFRGHPITI